MRLRLQGSRQPTSRAQGVAAATEVPLTHGPVKVHSRDPFSGVFHPVARRSRATEDARAALSLADIKRFMS